MSIEEKDRFKKFVFDKDKKSFLATRCLIRVVLSLYVPAIPPQIWKFTENNYGKPFIANQLHTSLYFNLSNSTNLAVCAISVIDEHIGIDTECNTRLPVMHSIMDISLSKQEKKQVFSLSPEQQQKQILLYWIIKEAYIKAQGLGLQIDLSEITVETDQDDAIYIAHPTMPNFRPLNWSVQCYDLASQHNIAVCSFQEKIMQYRAFSALPLLSHY
ncbi:MAG: 4'-phosphopantetheinyl transferase superfamily protein [Pseudomonadota bacterium]